mmetsp:Transcript_26601/g.23575  ORF Transcript_26601/g.23575 Transcript_26601/m.23575 type:complete len:174 (-) Transcript_26601:321-842(-)
MNAYTPTEWALFTIPMTIAWGGVLLVCMWLIPCPEHLKPKNNQGKRTSNYHKFYNNYPSILHAVSAVVLGIIYAFKEEASFGQPNNTFGSFIMLNSYSYLLYDTIASELLFHPDLSMRFHHILGVSLFGGSLFYDQSASELAYMLFIVEVPNPCNLYREILKLTKETESEKYF